MSIAHELSARLADLLRNERTAMAEFLVALADFDRRRAWADLGHDSLFAFLVRDLGLSNGAAAYRKAAVELVQRFPQVLGHLRTGELCITTVFELSKVVTEENAAMTIPRFFGASKRDAKNVVAELAPEPAPQRTVVRAVQAPSPLLGFVDPLAPSGRLADHLRANSEQPAQEGRGDRPMVPTRTPTVVEPKTPELSRVHVTVPRRVLDKLVAAKDALSHSHPNASDADALEVGLDLIIERHARRRGLVKNPRKKQAPRQRSVPKSPTPAAAKARARYVPAAVSRAIWQRDQEKCQWRTHDGDICGSTCRVELDHIEPFAKGGRILKPEDGRLLCRHHQDVSAREVYGDEHMNNYTKPKGPTCSEPIAEYGADCVRRARASTPRSRVSRTTRSRFPRAAPPRPEPFLRCPRARHRFGCVAGAARGRPPIGSHAAPLRGTAGLAPGGSPRCDRS